MSTPSKRNPAEPVKPVRVLYVDDMRELRDLMTLVLTREGHAIETEGRATHALEIVTAQPNRYDLIITDHHMDEMNGLDFVTALQKLPYRGKTIVFSSELAAHVNEAYLSLGVDRILQKPVPPSALRALIKDLFP